MRRMIRLWLIVCASVETEIVQAGGGDCAVFSGDSCVRTAPLPLALSLPFTPADGNCQPDMRNTTTDNVAITI